jgi:hypothetical protein
MSAGETRKFYRNMQYEQSARRLGVVALAFVPMLLPLFVLAFAFLAIVSLCHERNTIAHIGGAIVRHVLHSPNAVIFGMATAAVAPQVAPAVQSKANLHQLVARATRDQGPEFEQTLSFANGVGAQTFTTPTALKTDRKVAFYTIHIRGRFTNGATTPPTYRTAPPLLGTQLFGLIQQVTIRGQHVRYGAQAPIQMTGETAAEFIALVFPNYVPNWSVSVNGGALTKQAALSASLNATNDFDLNLPIPLFPPDISGGDIPFYCLHGPDWPGNLYMDIKMADVTALGAVIANQANSGFITAFGSASGAASIEINSERPLIGKDFMPKIRPAILFRTTSAQQPTAAVSGVSGSGVKLSDLVVGKDTTRIFCKFGTQLAATGAGITTFGSLSDTIATRTVFAMDTRALRFQGANGDSVMQDYLGRKYGRLIPAGYRILEFISTYGPAPANPKAAFPSSKLTAARKFEVDADVTAAGNQISEVVQEMTLGRPGLSA